DPAAGPRPAPKIETISPGATGPVSPLKALIILLDENQGPDPAGASFNNSFVRPAPVWPPKKKAAASSGTKAVSCRDRAAGISPPGASWVQAFEAESYSHVSFKVPSPEPPNSTNRLRIVSNVIPYHWRPAGLGVAVNCVHCWDARLN